MDPFFTSLVQFPETDDPFPHWILAAGEFLAKDFTQLWTIHDQNWLDQGMLFLLTRRGLGWVKSQGNYLSMEPGMLTWLSLGDQPKVYARSSSPWEGSFLVLKTDKMGQALISKTSKENCLPCGLSHPLVLHINSAFRSQKDGFAGDGYQISQTAYSFLMEWLRALSQGQDGRFLWIRLLSQSYLGNPQHLDLPQLVQTLGIEEEYFIEEWVRRTGTELEEFWNHLSLKKALSLFKHVSDEELYQKTACHMKDLKIFLKGLSLE